jgi:hypothetical protein
VNAVTSSDFKQYSGGQGGAKIVAPENDSEIPWAGPFSKEKSRFPEFLQMGF